jgi:soluble lytic murein transglycosylase-like protein
MSLFPFISAGVAAKALYDELDAYKRGEQYQPMIHASAKKWNVSPYVLAGLLSVESGFNPRAVGLAGEVGLGQFKPIAAKDVEVDFDLLKLDPELQIDASAALLALNTKRLGNVFDSIRAYNLGVGNAGADRLAGVDYLFKVLKAALGEFLLTIFRPQGV